MVKSWREHFHDLLVVEIKVLQLIASGERGDLRLPPPVHLFLLLVRLELHYLLIALRLDQLSVKVRVQLCEVVQLFDGIQGLCFQLRQVSLRLRLRVRQVL